MSIRDKRDPLIGSRRIYPALLYMRRLKPATTVIYVLFTVNCFLSSLFSPAYAKGPGTTGANFLKIGASGRQAAMGEATVGLYDDTNASLLNPAAWGRLRRNEASFLRTDWLAGINYTGLLYGHSTESYGNWGVSILRLEVPEIQGYDVNGVNNRTVKTGDQAFLIGHGRQIENLSLGGNLKFIRQDLDGMQAQTWALDIGAGWRTPWFGPSHRVDVGVSLRNLGSEVKFIREAAMLPVSLDLGAGYRGFNDTLTADIDLSLESEGEAKLRLGGEYWFKNMLALRLGYKPQQDLGSGLSFGFGLRIRNLYFDYAMANFGDLNSTNRLSMRFRFGGVVEKAYRRALEYASEERYVPALNKLDEVLEYEPYNAEALSQWRTIKQIYTAKVSVKETANPFSEGMEMFRQRRYLSAMDRFMEALLKQPEKEIEIRRIVTVIGAEMKGEELLAPEEREELKGLVDAGDYTEKKAEGLAETAGKLTGAKKHFKKYEYLRAYDILEKLKGNEQETVRATALKYLKKIDTVNEVRAKRKSLNPNPDQYYALAFLAYKDGRLQDACANWQRVLEYDLQNKEVKQYFESVKDEVNKTLAVERVKHLLESGQAHYQQGQYNMAKEAWQEAIGLDPQNSEILAGLEKVEAKLAEEKYRMSLKESYDKASLHYEAGQWSQTIRLLEDLEKTSPLEPDALTLLDDARHQLALAQEQARLERKKAAERAKMAAPPLAVPEPVIVTTPEPARDPVKARSFYQKGLIAYSQGNLMDAISYWEQSLTYDPDNDRVRKALERARLDEKSHLP